MANRSISEKQKEEIGTKIGAQVERKIASSGGHSPET